MKNFNFKLQSIELMPLSTFYHNFKGFCHDNSFLYIMFVQECQLKYKHLIHSVDPQSWPVVIIVLTQYHPSVLERKQISSENSDRYQQDCGSGRGDH